jgi:hypothetical protein
MISIAVSAQRTFTLPADLATTIAYFRDFERTIRDLQYLNLVKTYAQDQYRILYSTTEAGIYHVAFYCDIQVEFDEKNQAIRVIPLAGISPVSPNVTVNSMTGQGYYASQSIFQPAGSNTSIDYVVEIKAEVPKRLELKLVPDRVVKHVVENLVRQRLQVITDAYVLHTIDGMRQIQ